MKTSISIFAIALTAGSLAFFGAGCNPFQAAQDKAEEKAAEAMAERMLESMGGEGVDIDISGEGDDATVKFKSEDGQSEMMFGDKVELPDDLNEGVIIYSDATPISVIRGFGEGEGTMVTLETSDSVKDVTDWYEEKYEDGGWSSIQSLSMDGTEMRVFEKDSEQAAVTVGQDGEDGATMISITWSAE